MSVESAKKNQPDRIMVMGLSPYWVELVCRYLEREGFICKIAGPKFWFDHLLWLCRGRWRSFDAIYYVGGTGTWIINFILACTGKPILWHWIGTDVLLLRQSRLARSIPRLLRRFKIQSWPRLHAADSPDIRGKLQSLGIEAEVIRLLPERIEAAVEPLPESFTVLSYWTERRKTFYGGDIVIQLAREMPKVQFLILGAAEDEHAALPNVTLLGWQKNLESFYSQSSVLIRLPEHDSLSAMVLEMLARGRYVIYNQKMPGCHFARNYEEAKAALDQIRDLHTPNDEGAQSIQEKFSVTAEAGKAAALCRQLLQKSCIPAAQSRVRLITLGLQVCFIPVLFFFLTRVGYLRWIRQEKNRSDQYK